MVPAGLRGAGGAAADAQRQGRPRGAARRRPEAGSRRSDSYVPPRGPIEEAVAGHLGRAAGRRACRRPRRLLRAGRPLAHGDPAPGPGPRTFGVEVPLKPFSTSATVAALAELVEEALAGDARARTARRSGAVERDGAAAGSPSRSSGSGSSISSSREPLVQHPARRAARRASSTCRRSERALERDRPPPRGAADDASTRAGGVPYQVIAPRAGLPLPVDGPAALPGSASARPRLTRRWPRRRSGPSTWRAAR